MSRPAEERLERWEGWLLAAILLLAAVLRVGWPTLTEFKFSEARLEALALEITQEGRLPLVGVPSSAGFDHSPISVYLYAPAFLLTADPIPATIYGGLVNLAAVALCWWLARRWPGGGRWAALVAALLFAVNPWSVAFSRKIWQVAFVPPLVLTFVGLSVSSLILGRRWNLAWALVAFALLVQVHPSGVALAPALLLWLVAFWRKVKPGPLVVGGTVGLLTAAPFLVHQARSGWPALTALASQPGSVWDLAAVNLIWEAITGRGIHALAGDGYPLLRLVPQLGWLFNGLGWLAVASAVGLAWRMVRDWRADDDERQRAAQVELVLLSWLLAPVLFNLWHGVEMHLHFFALSIPVACLLIGRGVQRFLSLELAAGLKAAALTLLGALTAAQVVALLLMGRFVATHDTPGGFGTPLRAYLEIADQAVAEVQETGAAELLVVGPGDSIVVDDLPAILDVLLRGRVAYRFVDGNVSALFPAQRAIALLAPQAGEAAGWYASWPARDLPDGYRLVTLDGSWPQVRLVPASGPRVFQSGVELQAYDWQAEGAAAEGGRFWLLWQVLWLHPEDTHFTVRLVDAAEQVWGQQDAAGFPATSRQKGDRVISGVYIIPLGDTGAGPAWGQVGMYVYPEVRDVPVIDSSGAPVADKVRLGPLGEAP